jgi:hypothetical protein
MEMIELECPTCDKRITNRIILGAIILKQDEVLFHEKDGQQFIIKNKRSRWPFILSNSITLIIFLFWIDCLKILGYRFSFESLAIITYICLVGILSFLSVSYIIYITIRLLHLRILIFRLLNKTNKL